MSQPEPPATNRFGTPIRPTGEPSQQLPVPSWPPPAAQLSGPGDPSPTPYGAPTAAPANPYANPNANPWAAPVPPQVTVFGPPPRSRPVWLAPVAGLVVLLLVVAGFVAVHRNASSPGSSDHAASAGLPRALTDGKPSQISVVTSDSALAVAKAMWPLRTEAVATANLPLLNQIETGSALAADEAPSACGCAAHPNPAFNPTIVVAAPRQARFPATFVAQVTVQDLGSQPYVRQILVFQRLSSGTPWRVAFETEAFYPDQPTLPQPSAPGTYAPTIPPSDVAKVRLLASALARQWQRAKDTGKVPRQIDPFEPGYWTDQKDKRLAAHRNGTNQADGLLGRATFTTDVGDPVYLGSDGELVLACTVIHRTFVVTAHPGKHLIQDDARRNFGPQLPPGDYHQVAYQGIAQTCFETLDPSGLDSVEVFGGDEADQTTSMVGT